MGFGAGGAGALPNHEHTNIALDGGPLDFQNTTIASLNAGSTTFSNGAALQELVIGNAGETLTVNAGATAPEWGTGGGGTHTFLGSDRVTVARSSMTVSFPSVSGSDIGKITACFNYQAITSPATWRVTVNGITSAGWYNTQRLHMNAGVSGDFDSSAYMEGMGTGNRQCYGIMNFQCGTAESTAAGHDTTMTCTGSWAGETPGFRGGYFTCVSDNPAPFNSFDEIKLELSGGNLQTGSQLSVWANDIS
jgi:hypothetical protein